MDYTELFCHAAAANDRYWPYLEAHVRLWWLQERWLDLQVALLKTGFALGILRK